MLHRPLKETEKVISEGAFFSRIVDTEDTKHPNGRLYFDRISAEIFADELFENAQSIDDIKWMLEEFCGCLEIGALDWKGDWLREHPEDEEKFEEASFEPCVEVYV